MSKTLLKQIYILSVENPLTEILDFKILYCKYDSTQKNSIFQSEIIKGVFQI